MPSVTHLFLQQKIALVWPCCQQEFQTFLELWLILALRSWLGGFEIFCLLWEQLLMKKSPRHGHLDPSAGDPCGGSWTCQRGSSGGRSLEGLGVNASDEHQQLCRCDFEITIHQHMNIHDVKLRFQSDLILKMFSAMWSFGNLLVRFFRSYFKPDTTTLSSCCGGVLRRAIQRTQGCWQTSLRAWVGPTAPWSRPR